MSGRSSTALRVRHDSVARARRVAASVVDPELPMLTLADLGVLRDVEASGGRVRVSITPTYSGCPAVDAMRADLAGRLRAAGFAEVDVRLVLSPPWSSDDITPEGRRKLAEAGVSPPGPAPRRQPGPVPLTLLSPSDAARCPQCGSAETETTSRFGPTACRSLHRCRSCGEPFEHVKEI